MFPISEDEAVMTTSYIVEDMAPILYVSHDSDEDSESGGFWQFHADNGDYSNEKLKLVRLGTIMKLDSSIMEVANLPIGYGARRVAVGQPWIYRQE